MGGEKTAFSAVKGWGRGMLLDTIREPIDSPELKRNIPIGKTGMGKQRPEGGKTPNGSIANNKGEERVDAAQKNGGKCKPASGKAGLRPELA